MIIPLGQTTSLLLPADRQDAFSEQNSIIRKSTKPMQNPSKKDRCMKLYSMHLSFLSVGKLIGLFQQFLCFCESIADF